MYSSALLSFVPSNFPMKHHLGLLLQLIVLAGLPCLILFQLEFGFRLIVMPICLIIGMVVFWLGWLLREK